LNDGVISEEAKNHCCEVILDEETVELVFKCGQVFTENL
jgi:hypothetical protein